MANIGDKVDLYIDKDFLLVDSGTEDSIKITGTVTAIPTGDSRYYFVSADCIGKIFITDKVQ